MLAFFVKCHTMFGLFTFYMLQIILNSAAAPVTSASSHKKKNEIKIFLQNYNIFRIIFQLNLFPCPKCVFASEILRWCVLQVIHLIHRYKIRIWFISFQLILDSDVQLYQSFIFGLKPHTKNELELEFSFHFHLRHQRNQIGESGKNNQNQNALGAHNGDKSLMID